MAADGIHRLFGEQDLTRLSRLFLNSRFTVEGQLQGAHRSPLKGFSIEFSDYRQYVPGDDLRHLDWRVFGRRERLYIRQYEEECKLRLFLLVDGSSSMAYGFGDVSKYQYAARLAAALAYVTVHQHDSVGLTIFNSAEGIDLPLRSGRPHLRQLTNQLADFEPKRETDLATTIHHVVNRVRRRALFVIISDLFDDLERLRHAFAHFRRRKHDVVIYHVLDRAEIDLPFRDLGNFRDLETGQNIITNPRGIRRAYQERVTEFLRQVQSMSKEMDTDYMLATTDTPLLHFIRRHLNRRMGKVR